MQRGGSPTCLDRYYASIMGAYAADILCAGSSNRVVAYKHGEFVDYDIEEALAMQKEIPEYHYQVSKALAPDDTGRKGAAAHENVCGRCAFS